MHVLTIYIIITFHYVVTMQKIGDTKKSLHVAFKFLEHMHYQTYVHLNLAGDVRVYTFSAILIMYDEN